MQILTFITELNQIPGRFLWSFSLTFDLAYSPLNSAKLSCSSEVTLLIKGPFKEARGRNTQIREQMSGPKIFWYGKSILGCGQWPGLDSGKKGSGPIMSNFWGPFFHFFGVKKNLKFFLKNIIATALESYIKWLLYIYIFFFLKKFWKSWKTILI